jgi:hypothetical protein
MPMKNIQDLLKKKKISASSFKGGALDEKTLGRVFLEAAKAEIENFEETDVREMKIKEKTLYIKTAHPVVSSELFLRRENIIKKAEEILGRRGLIERIVI